MTALLILALKLTVAAFMATKLVLVAMAGIFCGAVMRALVGTPFGRWLQQRYPTSPHVQRCRGNSHQRAYAARAPQSGHGGSQPARAERIQPLAWRKLP